MTTFAEHQRAYFESLDWTLNDRSLSLLTGAPANDIATWRVALQKQGAADSAATLAVNGTYTRHTPGRRHGSKFDWVSVDWSKTNTEIAAILGTNPGYVSLHRGMLGQPSVTKHSATFRDVDWTKNDQEISAELGLDPGVVCGWRHRLGQPVATHYKPHWSRVSAEDIANVDWARFTDAELAREWGVGRERVRQIRQKNKMPLCKFKNCKQSDASILRWIDDHRDEFSGKTLKEASALIQSDRDMTVKARWLRRCGIKPIPSLECDRSHPYGPEWLPKVDWDLPNCVLVFTWKRKYHFFAINRYRLLKKKAAWHAGGGFSTFWKNEDFLAAVKAQFEVARKYGIIPDEKGFKQWIEYRSELNERVQNK